jgi:hypothetical protein
VESDDVAVAADLTAALELECLLEIPTMMMLAVVGLRY